ncbi:MAG: hypothetical protein ACKV2U_22365 [Bryobacteraceae bacterium]
MSLGSRILILCALTPLLASAAPAVDLFTGYSLGMVQPDRATSRAKLNGWNTSATVYPFSGFGYRLGLTADVAGVYGAINGAAAPSNAEQYSYMAGPQFRVIRTKRFETSFKALAGGAHAHTLGDSTVKDTSFAALIASNFDINLNRRVAFRMSPGMFLTRFGHGETQKNFRMSAGLVFRLGGGGESK